MIKLDVEEYCHPCLDFIPDVTNPIRSLSEDGKDILQSDTIIQCKHRKRCSNIKRYLELQTKTEAVG